MKLQTGKPWMRRKCYHFPLMSRILEPEVAMKIWASGHSLKYLTGIVASTGLGIIMSRMMDTPANRCGILVSFVKNQSVSVLLSHLTYDDCRTELLMACLQHREEPVVPLVSWGAFFFQQPCESRFSLHLVTASFSAGCQSRLCSSHEYTMPPSLSTPNLYLEI